MLGKTFDRPGLTALLDYLRSGDTLAVVRLDRLGRSLRELLDVVETLHKRGATLRSLEEQIDTSSAAGELVFHVFGAIVQFERRLIAERTHDGLAPPAPKAAVQDAPTGSGQAGSGAPTGAERDVTDQGGPADRAGSVNALPGTPGASACMILMQTTVPSHSDDLRGLQGGNPQHGSPETSATAGHGASVHGR